MFFLTRFLEGSDLYYCYAVLLLEMCHRSSYFEFQNGCSQPVIYIFPIGRLVVGIFVEVFIKSFELMCASIDFVLHLESS